MWNALIGGPAFPVFGPVYVQLTEVAIKGTVFLHEKNNVIY
jgi:hypothetical protein